MMKKKTKSISDFRAIKTKNIEEMNNNFLLPPHHHISDLDCIKEEERSHASSYQELSKDIDNHYETASNNQNNL